MEICEYCAQEFTLKKNLYAHLRHKHKVQTDFSQKKNKLLCALCDGTHKSYGDLRDHYISTHNYEVVLEKALFSSLDEFHLWKDEKEKLMKCSYVKSTGTKSSMRKKKIYYVCHRSGIYKEKCKKIAKKAVKSQGFVKSGQFCPSTLELTEEDGKFEAILFTPHIGHECSLKHINMTKTERAQIAVKIAEGVSFDRILDDVRNSMNKEEVCLERIHLLSRQDLRNIKKEFLLQREITETANLTVQNTYTLIAEHNHQMQKSVESNARIKAKLDILNAYVSKNKFNAEQSLKVEGILDDAIKMTHKDDLLLPLADKEPSNKNVTKQIGTKRKRKHNTQNQMSKPSAQEQQTFQEVLLSKDHLYCKKSRVFSD